MSTSPIAGEESGTASDWNTKQESWLDQKVKDKASELLEFLPFKGDLALHLNKTGHPPSQNVLCIVWLKLTQCSEEKIMWKVYNKDKINADVERQ